MVHPYAENVIASLRGTVQAAAGSTLVIEVGGVGYAVAVPPDLALAVRLGQSVFLHTATIVREDDISLFGFAERDQLHVFDLLRGVTGVGPRLALAVLAVLSPGEIATAVSSNKESAFTRVSGVGPKTAKQMILSLTGKLVDVHPHAAVPIARSHGDDVVTALVGLGYSEREARAALESVFDAVPAQATVPVLLKAALAVLGPQPAGTR